MSDRQKVTYRSEWIAGILKKVGKVVMYVVVIAVIFGAGWVVRGSTIEPPQPSKPQVTAMSTADIRVQAQKAADAMDANIGKTPNPELKLAQVTTGYCAQWLRIKTVPVAWDAGHFDQQPGPAPDNVYSPLWNEALKLYNDAIAAAKQQSGGNYADFTQWVSLTCPYQ